MRSPGFVVICIVSILAVLARAWTKEDHEIFRLRDEVLSSEGENVTFYDFIGVKPGATYDEINKAYKKRRRLLHPDKAKQSFIASQTAPKARAKSGKQTQKNAGAGASKGPSEADTRRAVKQANERFARLSVVAKILLGPDKERYDQFLNNGFPKWRGTGYYYARYRPGAGSVLLGLFLVGGGAAHYGALYLSWRRQRDFVGRYIRHARRAAWGDELGIRGVPALGESATSSALPEDRNEGAAQAPNRRQRRLQERKEGKKAAKATNDANAPPPTETARPGPTGNRKRVVAENGKVLVVDSVGNVYLEEENEDGEVEEYLLDVDEIPRPTIKQTVVYRLPIWAYSKITGSVAAVLRSNPKTAADASKDGADTGSSSSSSDSDEVSVDAQVPSAPNGRAGRRSSKR
ncbi:MAG: hypothetical protein M1815_003604 [Lichina confinis]|nr:MAG: hypothetical protein M1815_003604 [Lichina confinis]